MRPLYSQNVIGLAFLCIPLLQDKHLYKFHYSSENRRWMSLNPMTVIVMILFIIFREVQRVLKAGHSLKWNMLLHNCSICYCICIYILHVLTWCLTPLGKFLITLSATTAQNPLPPVSTSKPNKSKLIDRFLVFRNHLQFCCGCSQACRKMSTTTQQRVVDVAKHLLESKRKEQTHWVSIRIMQKWIMPGSNWHIISDISTEPAMHVFNHYLFHPTFSRSPLGLEGLSKSSMGIGYMGGTASGEHPYYFGWLIRE